MAAIMFFGAAFQRPARGILIEIRPASLLGVLPAIAYLRTIGGLRTGKRRVTTSSNPGVPSRTRGYYGPRAGELGFLFVLSPIGYLRTIGGIRTGRET